MRMYVRVCWYVEHTDTKQRGTPTDTDLNAASNRHQKTEPYSVGGSKAGSQNILFHLDLKPPDLKP